MTAVILNGKEKDKSNVNVPMNELKMNRSWSMLSVKSFDSWNFHFHDLFICGSALK